MFQRDKGFKLQRNNNVLMCYKYFRHVYVQLFRKKEKRKS